MAQTTKQNETTTANVPLVTLNDGNKMPQFGIGTFNQGSDDICYNSVLAALREGYRHIDTAHAYMDERGVGRAIKQFCKESGVPRSEIWVTSKLWPTEYGEGISLPAAEGDVFHYLVDRSYVVSQRRVVRYSGKKDCLG